MGGIRLVTLRGDMTEAGGAMVGGSQRKMTIGFGGRIQGASDVEKYMAEVTKYALMESTVNEAPEARTDQQDLRNKINALVDDAHATELRELQAEKAGFFHVQESMRRHRLEGKLTEIRVQAQQALSALDAAERTLVGAVEDGHRSGCP